MHLFETHQIVTASDILIWWSLTSLGHGKLTGVGEGGLRTPNAKYDEGVNLQQIFVESCSEAVLYVKSGYFANRMLDNITNLFFLFFCFLALCIGTRMFIHTATVLPSYERSFLSLLVSLAPFSLSPPWSCLTSCPCQSNSGRSHSCIIDEGSPFLSTAVEIVPPQLLKLGVETCSRQVTWYG